MIDTFSFIGTVETRGSWSSAVPCGSPFPKHLLEILFSQLLDLKFVPWPGNATRGNPVPSVFTKPHPPFQRSFVSSLLEQTPFTFQIPNSNKNTIFFFQLFFFVNNPQTSNPGDDERSVFRDFIEIPHIHAISSLVIPPTFVLRIDPFILPCLLFQSQARR